MSLLKAFFIAISTYTALPAPVFKWDGRGAAYSMCFFPFAGVLLAALWYGLYALCGCLDLSPFIFACLAVCLPLLFTGGIHADGYMDTVDALSSHAPRERKLEILKDSHAGAFAIIYLAVYILLQAAAFYGLYEKGGAAGFFPVFVLSRALSGVLALNMKNARGSGMLWSLLSGASRGVCTAVCALWGAAALTALYFFAGAVSACVVFAVCALWTIAYIITANKSFGGATGDTAGFYLQTLELLCATGLFAGALL
ncbi:MAG: adenosylcobinamide-GDP ribazoletransferase [Clostridia bacterium]|nr:adenosylcobinamide-GDP ribazoletransferase [Clostridia bacterium]